MKLISKPNLNFKAIIIAKAKIHNQVIPGRVHKAISTKSAANDVIALTADERVMATTAEQPVVAGATTYLVRITTAAQFFITGATGDGIKTTSSTDLIGPNTTLNDLSVGIAIKATATIAEELTLGAPRLDQGIDVVVGKEVRPGATEWIPISHTVSSG